ncbi:unnamed protein product [Linum trigynum]|uniref:Uncharacterized protein n=1 Tax=Linum trigynum TaxID=586398 RepID=A0AAV2D587_9ROSI
MFHSLGTIPANRTSGEHRNILLIERLCVWQGSVQNLPEKDFKLGGNFSFPQPDPALSIHPTHRVSPPTPPPVKLNSQMVSCLNRENPIRSAIPYKFIIHTPPRKWDSFNGPTDRRVKSLTKLILIPAPFPLTNNLRHQRIPPIWQDTRIIARRIQLKSRNPIRMHQGGRKTISDLPS